MRSGDWYDLQITSNQWTSVNPHQKGSNINLFSLIYIFISFSDMLEPLVFVEIASFVVCQ